MPITDFIDAQIVLGPGTTPEPAFGTSALIADLDSKQYNEFTKLAGGLSTLLLGVNGYKDTLETLGIPLGSNTYEQVDAHFTGFRKPNEMYLTYRGRAALDHDQRITVIEETVGSGRATPGQYRVTANGGPYTYVSPGVAQVITATVNDAGGGDATTGTYTITDGEGNNVSYTSGTKQSRELTVVTAGAGLYSIGIQGVTYSYTATGADTVTTIRDGLLADMTSLTAHPPHPDWVATSLSTDKITLNTQEFGVDAAVTAAPAPVGDLTEVETAEAGETIATVVAALVAAVNGASPVTYSVADASPAIVFTANLPGSDLGIQTSGRSTGTGVAVGGAIAQVVTTDHRETVTAVRDALDGLITAGTHPGFVNSTFGTDAIDIEGTVAGDFVPLEVSGPTTSSISVSQIQSLLEKNVAQTSRVTIVPSSGTSASDGLYEIILFGTTVSHTASSQTITQVRDALESAISGSVSEVTTAVVGTDSFDVTNNTAGQPFSMVLTSPNSNQAMTQAIITAVYGIGSDIKRAFDDEEGWYFMLNGFSDDLSIIEAGREIEGLVPGRSHVGQTSDTDNRDVQLAAALPDGDVGAALNTLSFQRTALFFHPAEDGAQAYKAPFSQWVGDYETDLPGQVNTHGVQLRGFQARTYTAQEAVNLQDRHATFLDRFRALDTQATNGGKNANGRKFDLIRGADQTTALLQVGVLNLMIPGRILPYTVEGIKEVTRVITEAFDDLVSQGFAIANSLVVDEPDLADATPQQAQDGVFPDFTITFVAQVGTDKVVIRGTITQQAGDPGAAVAA